MNLNKYDKSYIEVLNKLKQKIRTAQIKAALSANAEMIFLYWEIGNTILENQAREGWGAKIIDRLSEDLRREFPDMKGFSIRNLKYMRKFAESYTDFQFVQAALAQITWYHNITLLDKVRSLEERLWYVNKIVESGWSRDILVIQIESNLYKRQALAEKTTNFKNILPKPQSDLAEQMLKDPYKFDFLNMGDGAQERAVQKELIKHITKFLLELGAGFAYVGQQYHMDVGEQDFYIDLLFYHLKLRCYVVIELKSGTFKPEYAGKINFYLSAVDDLLRHPNDNPSIGIVLCKTKNKIIAEYALRDMTKPIGISEYKLLETIPDDLKSGLPTIKELEEELSNEKAGGE